VCARRYLAKRNPIIPLKLSFPAICVGLGLPKPVEEYRFHPVRRWRFDYAWPEHLIALEVEGGVFTGGRHTRGIGFVRDMEKYNTAGMAGWRVFRIQPKELTKSSTFDMLRVVLLSE
jgi:hypothetical protein